MTAAKAIEYQITQQLLRRRQDAGEPPGNRLVERVITIAAATATLVLLGSYLQELLWVVLAGSAVLTLATLGQNKDS